MPVSEGKRLRVLVVGFAGHQGTEYLPVMRRLADVVGGVDPAPEADEISHRHGFPRFATVGEALKRVSFDAALVTVPHSLHFPLCRELLSHGKHVLKEKPFAVTAREARRLAELARSVDRSVLVLVQRNFNPAFRFAHRNLRRIGAPYWFSYDYHMNLPKPTTGWRASREQASGGVLLDMGYHLVDALCGMFTAPAAVQATFLHCYAEMRERRLEDLVSLQWTYPDGTFAGSIRVSRHNHEKVERLSVLGSEGSLAITPTGAGLYSPGGRETDRVVVECPKDRIVEDMVAHYLRHLDDRRYRDAHIERQLATVRIIDDVYREQRTEQEHAIDRAS